ncbi:MAG TPA: endolytic transglycosylase MltG [Gaiellaceae bacterium]|nr:endolytic transglycosylase MltG [Gaiellaceae bacterium]
MRAALVAVAALLAATAAGCGGSGRAAPSGTTVRELRQFRVVFPEGFTRAEMANRVRAVAAIAEHESHRRVRLSRRTYLEASAAPRRIPGFGRRKLPLEGFLFPDTYDFDRTSTAAQLVDEQLREFELQWRTLDLSYARRHGLTPYDVLIVASMIEGEVQVPRERALVAAVIYNRLRDRMPLGIDATLRYGLHVPPTQPLTEQELHDPSPYNTRLHPGLPPTPIDNPGLAALQAAAHPAHVDYLYFVREPDHRHHYFTANYQDFLRHEAEYGY